MIYQQKQEQMLQKLLLNEQFKKLQKLQEICLEINKITSLGKTQSKEKEDERQKIYILPEKRQQTIDDLRLF